MLNAIIRYSLRHRLLFIALTALVLVYGWIALKSLPVDVLPDLNKPTVNIIADAEGMAPEEVELVVTKPIYMLTDTGFEFAPKTIGTASLSFVEQPLPIKWAFTLDVNGRRVYDVANSVQPVWNDISMMDIIVRALALIGVNLQLREVENYSQLIKTQGQ